MRRAGYYFVRESCGEWEIAYWSSLGGWVMQGDGSAKDDDDFEEIDGRVVTLEKIRLYDAMLYQLKCNGTCSRMDSEEVRETQEVIAMAEAAK